MKIIPFGGQRLEEYRKSVLETFEPNSKDCPFWSENSCWEGINFLNLNEQKEGTIVFINCSAPKSKYVIEINDKHLEIWSYNESERNGLMCPIESIVSYESFKEEGGIKIEEGILRKREFSLMPNFCYDLSRPRLDSVIKPIESWSGAYMQIFIKK